MGFAERSPYLDDWLGTRRIQTSALGQLELTCQSLPYGNGENCTATALSTAEDPTEQHFTGKERDAESGNDYFEARYYNSAAGRFLSPDCSAKEEPVPYAKLDDPQTLNLYAYARNNPMTSVDADGHWPSLSEAVQFVGGAIQGAASSVAFGLVGSPKLSDSNASLLGQEAGSSVMGGIGASMAISSGPTALAGLAAAPETLGASLLVSGGAIAMGAAGTAIAATAAKNALVAGSMLAYKAGGRMSPKTAAGAREAAKGQCAKCNVDTTPGQKSQKGVKREPTEGTTDHILAKSKGGTNEPSNAEHLCLKCNRAKSDK